MNKILAGVRHVLFVFVVITATVGLSSCDKYSFEPPAVDPNNPWSLEADIQPVFDANCIACHGGRVSPDLRSGRSHNSLTKGGYVDTPAEQSRLFNKLSTDPDHTKLITETDRLKILYWIQQGAENN